MLPRGKEMLPEPDDGPSRQTGKPEYFFICSNCCKQHVLPPEKITSTEFLKLTNKMINLNPKLKVLINVKDPEGDYNEARFYKFGDETTINTNQDNNEQVKKESVGAEG